MGFTNAIRTSSKVNLWANSELLGKWENPDGATVQTDMRFIRRVTNCWQLSNPKPNPAASAGKPRLSASPATLSSSSRGIPRLSKVSYETYSSQHILGFPADLLPERGA